MEMKEIHANAAYKILRVTLAKGEEMPRHYASSDAFLIVEKGKANVRLLKKEEVLAQGTTLHIPADEPHNLQVLEDFIAYVVLAADAQIQFNDL